MVTQLFTFVYDAWAGTLTFVYTANLSVVIFLVFIRVPVPAVVQLYSLALSDVPKEQL